LFSKIRATGVRISKSSRVGEVVAIGVDAAAGL
jgi:hypothetical protein